MIAKYVSPNDSIVCKYLQFTVAELCRVNFPCTEINVVIIIIIINFYGAYILRSLSSEAQQNKIIKHNREQGRAKVSIRTRDNRTFIVEMQFGTDMS